MPFRFYIAVVVCMLPALAPTLCQTPPASDPQALAYAAQSIAAITGGTTIGDVTLTGSVTWNGMQTGTATLQALGNLESRMDLSLPTGTRSEIRDSQTGAKLGQWINPNNDSGLFASQNCWTDSVWFFPVLGSLAAGTNVVLSDIGQTTWNGASVQHVQSYIYQSILTAGSTPSSQQLSTMDFYLDVGSLLPVAITFNAHPDNTASTNLLVEVDFSNYQNISGVLVPMRIQRYQQGTLIVDVTVTGAVFNAGLPLSTFAVN